MKLFELREGVRKAKVGLMAFFSLLGCIMILALADRLVEGQLVSALYLPFYIVLVIVGGNAVEHVTKHWNGKPGP